MASRHSTGFTYSLARNSCLNTSMPGECAICGRGAEFPRASARSCLTFPHCVYSAHRLSSRSFSSPTWCTGFTDSTPVDGKLLMQLLYHGELPTPPRFRFMVSLPRGQHPSLCAVRISLNSAIFLYTAGPATFRPLTAALDSSHFMQGGERKFLFFSLNSAMFFFSSQGQLLPPRHKPGYLAWESGLLTNRLAETARRSTYLNIKCLCT